MNADLVLVYILIWPVLVAITLGVLIVAVAKDVRAARRSGRRLV